MYPDNVYRFKKIRERLWQQLQNAYFERCQQLAALKGSLEEYDTRCEDSLAQMKRMLETDPKNEQREARVVACSSAVCEASKTPTVYEIPLQIDLIEGRIVCKDVHLYEATNSNLLLASVHM